MLSLNIVGYGKENVDTFVSFLKNEVKSFINKYNATIYNMKTLYKAEANIELLKKSSRLIFPTSKDADCEYWGMFDVKDYDNLYAKFFSYKEDSPYIQREYYTFQKLKLKLKQYETAFSRRDYSTPPEESFSDFEVHYSFKTSVSSGDLCVFNWTIGTVSEHFNTVEYFYMLISRLDALFPETFVSAYIDDSNVFAQKCHPVIFDSEMLASKTIDIGEAFYICNRIKEANKVASLNESNVCSTHRLLNGTFYVLQNCSDNIAFYESLTEKVLAPHYLILLWSDLCSNQHVYIPYFNYVSVYYDKYAPADPTIILSWKYPPQKLDVLASEHGFDKPQVRFTRDYLFSDN